MPELSEAEKRRAALARVLEDEIEFSGRRATANHYASATLMGLALFCIIAASVLGLTDIATAKQVGAIAALPAALAYAGIALKLEPSSYWHYHKYITLRSLLARLNFELSAVITVEDVRAISEELNKFNEDMRKERERNLAMDWASIGKKT